MPQIDRAGLYRGEIEDFAVSITRKAELPQLVVTFAATELYDAETDEWNDWAEYEQTLTGYFVLVTKDANGNVVKCLNYDQVMEAVDWDGETYSGLAAMDLKGKVVQFRVIEDTYKDTKTLKVNWIAAAGADIGLKKLSGKDLTDLDAGFSVATAKKASTPATPKKGKPAAPKKLATPKPPSAPKKKDTPAKDIETCIEDETCTQDEAYQVCIAANDKAKDPVPSHILDDYWLAQIGEIAADGENVTDAEWPKIREAVLKDLGVDDIPF